MMAGDMVAEGIKRNQRTGGCQQSRNTGYHPYEPPLLPGGPPILELRLGRGPVGDTWNQHVFDGCT
jgi:hypothetical protein